ncbi:MAG: type II toxin-antitoxin system HicB family antitoxin [Acidobacteriota bacterium]
MKTIRQKPKLPALTVVIEPGVDGYFVATCPELEVVSQGKTRKEAENMAREAVELVLETATEKEIKRRLARRNVVVKPLELAPA